MKLLVSSAVSVSLIFSSVGFAGEPVEATANKKVEAINENSNRQAPTSESSQSILSGRAIQERIDEVNKERDVVLKSQDIILAYLMSKMEEEVSKEFSKLENETQKVDRVQAFFNTLGVVGSAVGLMTLATARSTSTALRRLVATAVFSGSSFVFANVILPRLQSESVLSDEAKLMKELKEMKPSHIVGLYKYLVELDIKLFAEIQRLEAELQMSLK
jgi:hypothetical protein